MILRAADSASPYLHIGASNADSVNSTGDLVLKTGVSLSLEGGTFLLGSPDTANGGSRAGTTTLTVESGATLNIGTDEKHALWQMAQHNPSSNHTRVSSLAVQAGASAAFYLTDFQVGGYNGSSDGGGKAEGTVDLSAATVTAFDVSGDVRIGRGNSHQAGSFGTVKLPKLNGNIDGHLLVGDSPTRSEGRLELNGTHLEVGGDVTIDLTGRVKVTLGEGAGGLRLSAGSELIINASGAGAGDEAAGYFIDFGNATFSGGELLYGLAWEGDHLEALDLLVNSYAITWSNGPDGLTAGLFYDAAADLTYIGMAPIPEPGAVSLLAGGAALLACLGRRLKRPVA
ncbi:MAG TPA: hypothetical protein VNQ90_14340 [Chthoniobacteraceae bacterium]|nr:hypothetical protein [Chthoniobacteraceae bacterium]